MFFADANFLIFAAQNLCCFYVANFVADGIFLLDRHFLKNFLLLFLKTVYQFLFTFASMYVLHKAGLQNLYLS